MHHFELVFSKLGRRFLATAYALFILLALLTVQLVGFPQLVTGPIVNAGLLLAAIICGPSHAIGIGILTPVIAFSRGILPAPLAPMIPFIAISNGVFAFLFYVLYKALAKKEGLESNSLQQGKIGLFSSSMALLAAAIVKTLILSTAVNLVSVPDPVVIMMQWPQLITALMGGVLIISMRRI